MTRDPDYNLSVYGHISGNGQPYLVRVKHPRTKLNIFFEGDTQQEAIDKAEAFWEEYREERETAWANQEAARLKRKEKVK
jgi:hypothetical protein